MTIYRQFAGLLNDIEYFSEQQDFPKADELIRKARQAMRNDLRKKVNHLSNARKRKTETTNLRHH